MSKKTVRNIIILFIVYLGIAIVIIGPWPFLSRFGVKKHTHLLIGSDTVLSYGYLDWSESDDLSKITTNTSFDIYVNKDYIGHYPLKNNKGLWYYKKDDLYQMIDGPVIAITGSSTNTVIKYEEEEITSNDLNYLNNILKKDKIKVTLEDITFSQKIALDFDGDKKQETLYLASMRTEEKDKNFTVIFYQNNGGVKVLFKDIFSNEEVNTEYSYQIDSIIDMKKDGKYEVLISKVRPLNPKSQSYDLYGLSLFGNYKKLMSGKEE